MCGIAGFLSKYEHNVDSLSLLLRGMGNALTHRGPDDFGDWIDANQGIGLAHRRLSIVDVSLAGHQPMTSMNGRYVIIFNGEIYNHLSIRKEFGKEYPWNGHSDTETLLVAIEAWGLQETLQKCIGMFAIALWDKRDKSLMLSRDRIGEKPLYYGWQNNTFLFASELKALKTHSAFNNCVDRYSLSLYLRHGYIPAPNSIYQNIYKLMPGTILTLTKNYQLETTIYWSALRTAVNGVRQPHTAVGSELVPELDSLLRNAVKQQMMADVPLGAFLSGGIDSSLVVALMQIQSSQPIQTFSIGFDDKRYNEAEHAKKIACYLGTKHTELYVTPEDSMAVIPQLASIFDEPFADSSQIPTYLVSQLARQQVTISLSGDAGDELFAGYNHYAMTANLWKKLSNIPNPMRQIIAKSITKIPAKNWSRVGVALQKIIPLINNWSNAGDKLHKGAAVMTCQSVDALHMQMTSHWLKPSTILLGGTDTPAKLLAEDYILNMVDLNNIERMLLRDLLVYLPDDILCKVDRASMSVSLETRAPFLDHRVIEFAWKVPLEYKLHKENQKWILRQVLYRYIPKELIEKPKMGFCVPIDQWLRGPLRDWAESLLEESRLKNDGYFNPQVVRKAWQEHLSGYRNWQLKLWNVLMFNAWLDNMKT